MERVRIALQKSGRLAQDSQALLGRCGLHLEHSKDMLFCRVKELPIDLLMIRDDDIPGFVSNGTCDLGIVGENVFAEAKADACDLAASVLERLGFSFCRLSIAVPETSAMTRLSDLAGKTIATSYPGLLRRALETEGVKASTLTMSGSVEVAPRLKIADAICDVVASGATLAANGLREMQVILRSEALLIRSARKLCRDKEEIVQRLLARIRGSIQADDSKYVMLHAEKERLAQVIELLPGAESPTILSLQGGAGKVAVHAVCREAIFWETLEKLKDVGASAILVMPIEKMMA